MSRTASIIEDESLRGKTGVFLNRVEAGRHLASKLCQYKESSAIVLAIPSGGVPVGLAISRELCLPFDLVIVRKIPIPGNTEAGFGALTLQGDLFLDTPLVSQLKLTNHDIDGLTLPIKRELIRRNEVFRSCRPFKNLQDKTIILVDDGLASGYTMLASIHIARRQGAKKVIAAIPTAPISSISKVAPQLEEIYCLNIRETSCFAVADAYKVWHDLNEEEVIKLLSKGNVEPQ